MTLEVLYIGKSRTPQSESGDDGARAVLAVNDHWSVFGFGKFIRQTEHFPERHVQRTRYMTAPVLVAGAHVDDHGRRTRPDPSVERSGGYPVGCFHIISPRNARKAYP
jgi:hypothetical protein